MKLNKAGNTEIKQGELRRIFGFGNIVITKTDSIKVIISKVYNPLNIKKKIDSLLDN